MNRQTLIDLIADRYSAQPEYLWARAPNYAVFRHALNRKWFCLLADVPGNRLGTMDPAVVDVVNLKVTPDMVEPLMKVRGVFPGYHMDKRHWVSVILDGWADDDFILKMLKDSFDLTASQRAAPVRTRKVIRLSDRPKLSTL